MENKQQDMGTDPTGKTNTGGFGTRRDKPDGTRGGEQGEKRPTNADHDQKVADNRRRIFGDDNERSDKKQDRGTQPGDRKPASTADDVLGETKDRAGKDADHEREAGDIVSGGEHEEFPGTQAGYDDRKESQRPPAKEAREDLSALDKGRNDDLSDLDQGEDRPLK